ncbi:MAG: site-specific integrase [candidate division NC10 bacterium]
MAKQEKAWEIDRRRMRQILSTHDGRSIQGKRDRAILMVMAHTGMRIGELARLTVGDFDAANQTVTVGTLKQRRTDKTRTLPLQPVGVTAISTYLSTRNGRADDPNSPLFLTLGKHGKWQSRGIRPAVIQGILKRALTRAGVNGNGHGPITCHSLRHNYATQLLRSGSDLK